MIDSQAKEGLSQVMVLFYLTTSYFPILSVLARALVILGLAIFEYYGKCYFIEKCLCVSENDIFNQLPPILVILQLK